MNKDEFIIKLPRTLSEKYNIVPKEANKDSVIFWTNKFNENVEAILKVMFKNNVGFEIIDTNLLKIKRDDFYNLCNSNKLILNFSEENLFKNIDTMDSESEVAIALKSVLEYAIQNNASDIHFDSNLNEVVIRVRIDGILSDIAKISKYHFNQISTRIKILSNLDYTIKNIPLDGRFTFNYNDKSIDIRVAITPTTLTEKIVLRILDKNLIEFTMEGIGLNQYNAQLVEKLIRQPNGLLLVAGPTGSGKSSTLYTLINKLASREINIITVEDPVEYKIDGINQIEINKSIGRTFNEGLKSILRLDPDKIMVGEIRDKETAQTALRAAITGHLVMASIHTNDSPSAIYRLKDMGIENYLISAGLIGVISQRLVRKLCDCSKDTEGYIDLFSKKVNYKKPVGCSRCRNGYLGRTAVFEILILTDDLKEAIVKGCSLSEFKILCEKNMVSLKSSMLKMIEDGITSLDEVYKNIVSIGEL